MFMKILIVMFMKILMVMFMETLTAERVIRRRHSTLSQLPIQENLTIFKIVLNSFLKYCVKDG